MAAINDLLRQVSDPVLRGRLEEEIDRLSKNKKFGLVFEDHIPECTPLYGVGIRVGGAVARKAGQISDVFVVLKIDEKTAKCYNKVSGETVDIPIDELVAVAQFGEPIFPMLQAVDSIQNAPDSSLWH
jgi:adenine-specific DNA-methyltransferase